MLICRVELSSLNLFDRKTEQAVEKKDSHWSESPKAGGKGFEPLLTDPESVVLPLDEPPTPAGGILPCRQAFRLVPGPPIEENPPLPPNRSDGFSRSSPKFWSAGLWFLLN